MGKKPRQNVRNKINQEMGNHVCRQIAAPKIKRGQECTYRKRDHDIGPTASPMTNRENGERNSRRPKTIQAQRLQAFDRISAKKQFLDHTGAKTDQRDEPDREPPKSFTVLRVSVMRDGDDDTANQNTDNRQRNTPNQRSLPIRRAEPNRSQRKMFSPPNYQEEREHAEPDQGLFP